MENENIDNKIYTTQNWLTNNWFKLGILIAIFASIYLLLILPEQKAEEARAEKDRTQQRAKLSYDSCVVSADVMYSNAWKSRCSDYKVFNENGWKDCMNMPYAMKSICDSTWNNSPTEEEILDGSCTLPKSWAESLAENRDKNKEACLSDYNMSLF